MPEKLRVGIIGLGWGLSVHLPALRSIPDFEVVALCSRTKEKVEEAAKENNIPHVYNDYREMVRQKDIDVISIVTPVITHYSIVLEAIRHGKHVICEKPIAMNETEAKDLYVAAKEAGISHMVCHELRWIPERLALRDLLVSKDFLGTPYFIQLFDTASYWHPTKPLQHEWLYHLDQGGGYLNGKVSHNIDFLRYLFGDITAVNAQVVTSIKKRTTPEGKQFDVDADDTSILNVRFANGSVGVLTFSAMALHGVGLRLEAYGSKGSVVYTMDNAVKSKIEIGSVQDAALLTFEPNLRSPKHPIQIRTDFDPEFIAMQGGIKDVLETNEKFVRAMALLLEDFAVAIRSNLPTQPSLRDGWKVQQIIDAAKKSSETGQWVEVQDEL